MKDPAADMTQFMKITPYSDNKQLRGFLKSQLCGSVPELTPETVVKPNDKERTIIITGSNTGLGLDATKQILRLGVAKRLVMACRNLEKGAKAREEVLRDVPMSKTEVLVWQLDMTSRASIRAFTERARRELDRIDAAVLNAGVVMSEYQKVADSEGGFEMTIMVNVVGTMVLAGLMVPILKEKMTKGMEPPRISIVGSAVQFFTTYDILLEAVRGQTGEGVLGWLSDETRWKYKFTDDRYYLSKGILQVLVAQLAKEITDSVQQNGEGTVVVNCVAPGYCRTDLFRDTSDRLIVKLGLKLVGREASIGARALVVGALGVEGGSQSHGKYMSEGIVKKESSWFTTQQGIEVGKMIWEEILHQMVETRSTV